MKYIVQIILVSILASSCTEKKASIFFDACKCHKVDLTSGIFVNDDLGDYYVKFPDSSWLPMRHPDGNGISGSDVSQGYMRFFSVNEMEKSNPWPSRDKQNDDIRNQFNVLESGVVNYNGQICDWHLVRNDDNSVPINSLMITIEHPTKNRFFTVNLSVEQGGNLKKRICELESFLDEFIIE